MAKTSLSADRREHAMTRRQLLGSVLGVASVAVTVGVGKSVRAAPALPAMVKIELFSADGRGVGVVQVARVIKTEAQWREQLSAEGFVVTRQAGTERPFSGEYWNNHAVGLYHCVCCDTALFDSKTKFESGTGWPSFWKPLSPHNVVESVDSSLFMQRNAVSCGRCDAHLGHVFDDGPRPTGLRYCMNSVSLKFHARA
jgi:peptide-methionine (R)-S-oxide reductase